MSICASSSIPSFNMLRYPAPAKLNLFLHVVGRRADGYHLLQSVFQLIDLCDYLEIDILPGTEIVQGRAVPGVSADDDLTIRAARLLQAQMAARGQALQGARIGIEKNLPLGGGVGGGSSDAATTLIVLNNLWQAGFTRSELMQIGLQLGADVPFFIFGHNAFVEGIGEQMQAVATVPACFVLLAPGVHTPTPQIFSAKDLTRNTDTIKIADFSSSAVSQNRDQQQNAASELPRDAVQHEFGRNDLQAVASKLFPQIDQAITWLSQFGDARMTGSGSCIFCRVKDEAQAEAIVKQVPKPWKAWKTGTLVRHPLAQLLD